MKQVKIAIFAILQKAPPSESGAKITGKDDESGSDSENDSRDHLRIGSENDDKDSPSVDEEGFTIPKPERKNSTTSESSGWESDENEKGKIDTFGKIKVEIKALEDVAPAKDENVEMIKLSGPLQVGPRNYL